jgi:hypothetical protein
MAQIVDLEKNIQGILARDLTLDQIREKIGGGSGSPVGNIAATSVDELVTNLLDE